jgi:hypothetical protein
MKNTRSSLYAACFSFATFGWTSAAVLVMATNGFRVPYLVAGMAMAASTALSGMLNLRSFLREAGV